mmetsp:Transcript_19219/g.25025  ORF Transcript_19219/g.25025 Transcript_19219/m.25025 type:complete len:471 (+) Transcript_19219:36-1448(+)
MISLYSTALIGSIFSILFVTVNALIASIVTVAFLIATNITPILIYFCGDNILQDKPIHWEGCSDNHDKRRHATYMNPVANTWYHFADTDELTNGKVLEIKALNNVYALWRDPKTGKPICHEAFCPHLGANLAIGGKVNNDGKIVCPFHSWEFNADGTIHSIPYLEKDDKESQSIKKECKLKRKLKLLPCVDFCGLVMVFYHENEEISEPTFPLPFYIQDELNGKYHSSIAGIDGTKDHFTKWSPHLKWNVGFVKLLPNDWVDQAGDHAHFHTLHNEIVIPWTRYKIPQFIHRMFPFSIKHRLVTYKGTDDKWSEKAEKDLNSSYKHTLEKSYIFFTDIAGIAYNNKLIKSTESETLEMYVGPALMIFHIPFTLGAFKVFVSTTPCEGGSVMRVRTFCNTENKLIRFVAWVLGGLSGSQLDSDIVILQNKVRLSKPLIQPYDGPYNRVSGWFKQFYSEGSDKKVNKYCLDW